MFCHTLTTETENKTFQKFNPLVPLKSWTTHYRLTTTIVTVRDRTIVTVRDRTIVTVRDRTNYDDLRVLKTAKFTLIFVGNGPTP